MGILDALLFGYRELIDAANPAWPRRTQLKIVGGTLSDDGSKTVLTITGGGDPTMGGDVSGTASACTVEKLNGIPFDGGPGTEGEVPRITAGGHLQLGPVDLANNQAVTGILPVANGGTGSGTAPSGGFAGLDDVSAAANAAVTVAEAYTDASLGSHFRAELPLLAGLAVSTSNTFARIGGRKLDLSQYPATIGLLNRRIDFVADLDISGGATDAEVKLVNVTDNEDVSSSDLTSNSATNDEQSATLTQGTGAGDVRTDHAAQYQAYLRMVGGTPGTDQVTCTNARIVITYE